jgi:hypothetical protein
MYIERTTVGPAILRIVARLRTLYNLFDEQAEYQAARPAVIQTFLGLHLKTVFPTRPRSRCGVPRASDRGRRIAKRPKQFCPMNKAHV